MNRRINQEIKLSNGIVLEKGIHVGVASAALGFDPEIYPDPHKFDGFRFYKLRQIPGNEKKWHVSILLTFQTLTLRLTYLFYSLQQRLVINSSGVMEKMPAPAVSSLVIS